MAITLTPDAKKRALASIKQYVSQNLDQEIGDLQAGLLLDFVLEEIGPCIYNRAIEDAQTYLQDRVADLEGVCHEQEFVYWRAEQGNPRTRSHVEPQRGLTQRRDDRKDQE